MKRNIVITGGAGFIGSHVVRLFVNKYPEYNIICLDKLTYAGNLANLKDIEDKPNYKFVKMDICDFEAFYQLMHQGYARGLDRTKIDWINDFACNGTKPDLTLLLDLSTEQGSARTHARAAVENDRFDSETETFHQKIRAGFLDLAKAEPERFAIVDATGTIEEVHRAIMEVIHERLA